MKKLPVICLLFVGIILISGCINEEKTNSKTTTIPLTSMPELIPSEFDININSYYLVYMKDKAVINRIKSKPIFDLFEKNYVIYHLSIKNNGTNTLNFSTNKLQLHTGNKVFTPAGPGTIVKSFKNPVISEIVNENRLNDTLLHPDQTVEGIVIFQVCNYTTLFDRSFSLMYNKAHILSTSYEKSFKSLSVAEQFDYSIAFDMPPYDIDRVHYSYDPPESRFSQVWANWVNRTVFEYFKEYDEIIGYAIKVIPEQDLNVFFYRNHYTSTQMHVVDDTGEELFNRSIDFWTDSNGLAIYNQKYRNSSKTMPQMFIPQATTVYFYFYSYGVTSSTRISINNQDIILDEQHNIILARYENVKAVKN